MSDAEAPSEPVRRAQEALMRKAGDLAESWIAEVQRRCDVDAAAVPIDDLLARAKPLVHEVISGIHGSAADGGTSDRAHADAFVATARSAGLELPLLIGTSDILREVLVAAALAELGEAAELEATEAFAFASRIHDSVRPLTAAAADSCPNDGEGGSVDERFSSFTRALSHELKNPLGAARGAAELLLSGEGTESEEMRERFTQLVLRNINRTLELLEDVRSRQA